ncbi:HEAT repeat domain-containing protein [Cellulomonas humilata]|uniref:HEAT repeat protein n=1 Tax=Cellulomonas humilata TaxID=144055 RepID=A0ABU0EKQ7_9CELL|nr:HEAT repeat domain-containing protein [Cellulomonas humilata]MDQ0375653.1 HEAT repeat protein [Cellulomonas humilata]
MDSRSAWTQLLALGDQPDDEFDDDAAGRLVHLLQQRGESVVLEWTLPALTDPNPWRREAAAWVLGELGYEQGRPFGDQVMPALVRAARSESVADTRQEMVSAIGSAEDPAWVPELLSYADDDAPEVRETVARLLPGMFAGDDLSAEAVAALVTLTRDVDPGVRDWATFGLGVQSTIDDDVIRNALADRLEDDGGDTRFEAVLGLARRGDARALSALRHRLDDEQPTICLLDIEAAAELADPALLATLRRLAESWAADDVDDDPHSAALAYAIERSEPGTHLLAAAAQTALARDVNLDLVDIGWSITVVDDYPRTVLVIRRPDGSAYTAYGETRLWEHDTPTRFDADKQVALWTATVRGVAATDEPQ